MKIECDTDYMTIPELKTTIELLKVFLRKTEAARDMAMESYKDITKMMNDPMFKKMMKDDGYADETLKKIFGSEPAFDEDMFHSNLISRIQNARKKGMNNAATRFGKREHIKDCGSTGISGHTDIKDDGR